VTAHLDVPIGFHVYRHGLSLLEPAAVATFLRATRHVQPVLVVFDTLARCMTGGDENSALHMGRVVAVTDRVRVELGATVLFLHHTTKAGGSERGSSALRGALDTLLALNPVDDQLTLSVEKQKDAPPFAPIELRLDPFGGSCVIRPVRDVPLSTTNLSAAQTRCLRAFRNSFPRDAGATGPQWLDVLPDINRPPREMAIAWANEYRKRIEGRLVAGAIAHPLDGKPYSRLHVRENHAIDDLVIYGHADLDVATVNDQRRTGGSALLPEDSFDRAHGG
jgi:hypothetical protein